MSKNFDFKVNKNKNGYEIRSDILGLASQLALEEYKAKMAGWELECKKAETGEMVANVVIPEFPGLEHILTNAQKLYDFVNNSCDKNRDSD